MVLNQELLLCAPDGHTPRGCVAGWLTGCGLGLSWCGLLPLFVPELKYTAPVGVSGGLRRMCGTPDSDAGASSTRSLPSVQAHAAASWSAPGSPSALGDRPSAPSLSPTLYAANPTPLSPLLLWAPSTCPHPAPSCLKPTDLPPATARIPCHSRVSRPPREQWEHEAIGQAVALQTGTVGTACQIGLSFKSPKPPCGSEPWGKSQPGCGIQLSREGYIIESLNRPSGS